MSTTGQPSTDAPLHVDSWPASYGSDAETRVGFFTDTTLCIGCKACEVACKEWNEVPADGLAYGATSVDNSFDLGANRWRHVAFVEQQVGLEELAGRAAPPTRDAGDAPADAASADPVSADPVSADTARGGLVRHDEPGHRGSAAGGCGTGACGCGSADAAPGAAAGGLSAEQLAARGLTAPAPPELVPSPTEAIEAGDLVALAELGTSVTPEQDPTGVRWLMSSDVCKHCTKAACLEVCPTGAIFRTEFGTVVVQPDVCNGCGYCVVACPFGVLDRRQDDGRVWKCTLCYDRLRADAEPACAKACPTDSIQFGPLEELRERADRRLEVLHERGEHKAQLYLNTTEDGIGGAGAFFLLRDDPEVYGLPPDPVDTTTLAGEAWRAAGIAALGMVATALGAAWLGRR